MGCCKGSKILLENDTSESISDSTLATACEKDSLYGPSFLLFGLQSQGVLVCQVSLNRLVLKPEFWRFIVS